MKQILIVIFILSFIGLHSFKSYNTDYVLTVKKGKTIKRNKQLYLIVPVTLTNNSKDILNYLSMSCSWEDLYVVDHKNLTIEGSVCDKNIPTILTLAPGKKKTVALKLITGQVSGTAKKEFKIGYNLIKSTKRQDLFQYSTLKKKKNIIWSNTVSI
ncbi:DUF4352 domain-containing protein [Flavobacterium amniphilum]|uniref:DUF4352 domain-containing protein n=1 Tax=Flavobacterium amniphilum TaxID=1834035 RepID=UPI00202A27A8|nr:DUF4352 domain-containing protein [Flavobacterium amniphilum]MCL9804885.1 DUF4352 domain-containing protein [Flavobacterium amniphilum]